MSNNAFSIILQCWRKNETNYLKVIRVDTGEEVKINKSNFLLRFFVDDVSLVERCFIRHLSTGREAYIQSGPGGIRAFIQACLLKDDIPSALADPDKPAP